MAAAVFDAKIGCEPRHAELHACVRGAARAIGGLVREQPDRSFVALGLDTVLVYSAAAHQTMNDLGSLMVSPWRRAMGGEVSCGSDEDRRGLSVALPSEVLAHGGLQILRHVETSVLA
jgi:hypothetical protein